MIHHSSSNQADPNIRHYRLQVRPHQANRLSSTEPSKAIPSKAGVLTIPQHRNHGNFHNASALHSVLAHSVLSRRSNALGLITRSLTQINRGNSRMHDTGARSLSSRHTAERLARAGRLSFLLVGGQVEGDEQHQVRADDADARERGELLTGALTGVGQVREVGRGEVVVGGEVDEAEVDDELDDLQTGDPFLPPDADATRGLEVVPVHDDVDHEVERDGDPGDGGVADQLGVAEDCCGAVVIAVQEGQGLLLEEEEDGVQEFQILGQVGQLRLGLARCPRCHMSSSGGAHVVKNHKVLCPATFMITDGEEDTLPHNSRQELLNVEREEDRADSSEDEVMPQEQGL